MEYAPKARPGRASSQFMGEFAARTFLYGDTPPLESAKPVKVDPSIKYETLQVVMVDPNTGLVVPAVKGTPAIGVVSIGGSDTDKLNIYFSGHFVMQELVYDASYATDDDKLTAFNGATNLTRIAVSKVNF